MEKSKSAHELDYKYLTFRTGTRPFEGILMLLESMVINFNDITSHTCGSFSTTNDLIAKNAISDIAIVMSYSLLEGFFHEEYEYYLKQKKPKKPKELNGLINTLLNEHKIELNDWREKRKLIDSLRILRNSVVHSNGIIESGIDKNKCKLILGEDVFELNDDYPVLSLSHSILLLKECKKIADEYADRVFIKKE